MFRHGKHWEEGGGGWLFVSPVPVWKVLPGLNIIPGNQM